LICPRLFDYRERISTSLVNAGYDVTTIDPRASSGSLYRIALRLWPRAVSRLSHQWVQSQLAALPPVGFEHVLVVKGEGLSSRAVRLLRESMASARMTLYLWDGLANTPASADIARHFDRVATFDPIDAQEQGWQYHPLFGRDYVSKTLPCPPVYDCAFIGTMHSDRHRVLMRLRAAKPSWRFYVYCYFQSPLVLAARFMLDPPLWRAEKGTLGTTPLSAPEVSAIYEKAACVLDIEHPGQRGLTVRTIECLLAGRKLITTNRHILRSDLYHPSRVCVIERHRPEVPDSFLKQPFAPIDERTASAYSVEAWSRRLLNGFDGPAAWIRPGGPMTTASPRPR